MPVKPSKEGSRRRPERLRANHEPTPKELREKHTLPPGTTLREFLHRMVRPLSSEADRAGN